MNLTTLKSLIKRGWPFLFVAILCGLAFTAIYLKYGPKKAPVPTPPTINQNPSLKQPQVIDTSKLGKVELPKTLPTYHAEKTALTQDVAQKIAEELSIKSQPVLVDKNTTEGTLYTWVENGKILSVSETAVTYKNTGGGPPQNEDMPEDSLIKQTADTLNSYTFIGGNLALDPQKTSYLEVKDDRYKSTSGYQNAKYLQLSFDIGLSGYPIYTNSTSPSLVTVIVRKDGSITSLTSRYFNSFRKDDDYKLKSLNEAITEIKSGKGNIISTYTLDENNQAVELYSVAPVNIKNTDIISVKIAYFLQKNLSEPIQPIFVFTGLFTNANQNGRVLIYLPAIKTPTDSSTNPQP